MLRNGPKARHASKACIGCPYLSSPDSSNAWVCTHVLSKDKGTCPYPDRTIQELRDGQTGSTHTSVTCPLTAVPGIQCRKDCAWLLRVQAPDEHDKRHACAMAVLASHLSSNRHDIEAVTARFFEFKSDSEKDD